jgi:hypothetical protein
MASSTPGKLAQRCGPLPGPLDFFIVSGSSYAFGKEQRKPGAAPAGAMHLAYELSPAIHPNIISRVKENEEQGVAFGY